MLVYAFYFLFKLKKAPQISQYIFNQHFCLEEGNYLVAAYKFSHQGVELPQVSSENPIIHKGHTFQHLKIKT